MLPDESVQHLVGVFAQSTCNRAHLSVGGRGEDAAIAIPCLPQLVSRELKKRQGSSLSMHIADEGLYEILGLKGEANVRKRCHQHFPKSFGGRGW
jgi:hypothetical protein